MPPSLPSAASSPAACSPRRSIQSDGTFALASATPASLIAEISTNTSNGGSPVGQRDVLRISSAQVAASGGGGFAPANIVISPLSTEVLRVMENDGLNFATTKENLAERLGVDPSVVLSNPNTINDATQKAAVLAESVVLTNRFTFAAKLVDRGDAANIPAADQAAMNIEGIPRYDHIFIVMLENKATSSIVNSPFAPKINALLAAGNQFTNYFATGNPSEPNYTALGGADDFGITDDNQWNCNATGSNAPQDLPLPDKTQPGLAKSPFAATCSDSNQATAVNHNITGHANLFNALTSGGMGWRTYSESTNPGQDLRTDSVADPAITATDHVYPPGTLAGNAAQIGSATLTLPFPAGLYKTKHHPGMAYQNVRSAVEFKVDNRTLGGGQWDNALLSDIGAINFVVPDQCDDMHGISVSGTDSSTGTTVTASDCSSVANNTSPTNPANNIIARGDNYVQNLVAKIENSAIWKNPNKRVAIVLMFDEGNATSGFNSCCGWNPTNSTAAKPLIQNPDGTFSPDASVANYTRGNRGHGNSIFSVQTNQAAAPKGIKDSDAYSHFAFVRTLQDMFGLADPKIGGSYMNRSKYTEAFISANILNLPEYASSADTHFDSVRPMNHQFVIPAAYTEKQSADQNTTPQVGPDPNQVNVWALK